MYFTSANPGAFSIVHTGNGVITNLFTPVLFLF